MTGVKVTIERWENGAVVGYPIAIVSGGRVTIGIRGTNLETLFQTQFIIPHFPIRFHDKSCVWLIHHTYLLRCRYIHDIFSGDSKLLLSDHHDNPYMYHPQRVQCRFRDTPSTNLFYNSYLWVLWRLWWRWMRSNSCSTHITKVSLNACTTIRTVGHTNCN